MRRFFLQRDQDASGISGTGKVAEGVEFEDGVVAMQWLSHKPSIGIYRNIKHLRDIHGHEGASHIVWEDPDPLENKLDKPQKRGKLKA